LKEAKVDSFSTLLMKRKKYISLPPPIPCPMGSGTGGRWAIDVRMKKRVREWVKDV
jgi:hypothetical protein